MGIVVTGEVFYKGQGKAKRKWAVVTCDVCAKTFQARWDSITIRKSCGCDRGTHRHSRVGGPSRHTRTYSTWQSMVNRCRNVNAVDYAKYGGRGITFCDRWARFELFLEDMGDRPPGTSIDRIDGNRGYEKENCRWASAKEQAANRHNTRWITVDNVRMTISEAARIFGINGSTISRRIEKNMSETEAAKTPVMVKPCVLTIYGKGMSLKDWCNISGIKVSVARQRLKKGWTHKQAIFGKLKE